MATPVRPRSTDPSAFVQPIPGGTIGRADEGVDISASPGAPVVDPVPGISVLFKKIANWYAGQPFEAFKVISGPFAGKAWYAAEQIDFSVTQEGQQVSQGQQIGKYASSGTATEFGWADPGSGEAAARGHYTEGVPTAEGTDFKSRVQGATGGIVRPGPAGAGTGAPDSSAQMQELWKQYERSLSSLAAQEGADLTAAGSSLAGQAGAGGHGPAWTVTAGAEDDPPGTTASCGPLPGDGRGYSVASLSGTAHDPGSAGQALSPGSLWPCGAQLVVTNPATGKTVTIKHVDNGSGSDSYLPVIGIYPGSRRDLGITGNPVQLIIRAGPGAPDLTHPLRAKPAGTGGPLGLPAGAKPVAGGTGLGNPLDAVPSLAPIDLLTKVASAISGPADFLKWIAWIFHPGNILRFVEFVTGLTIMAFGLHMAVQERRGVQGQSLARRVVTEGVQLTPAGRVARVGRARAQGRSFARGEARRREINRGYKEGRAGAGNRAARRRALSISREEIPF